MPKEEITIIAGCGGGYDVFGGLPLYNKLRIRGERVILLNFAFTNELHLEMYGEMLHKKLFKVRPNTMYDCNYFPEARLATELNDDVYAIPCHSVTISEITAAYQYLTHKFSVKALYLVDGGCDALMTGSEEELGTPVEDMMHIKAVMPLQISEKFVLAVGVCVDKGHGITETDLQKRLADLKGCCVSQHVWKLADKNVDFYSKTFLNCDPAGSIVHSLINAALMGEEGYFVPETP